MFYWHQKRFRNASRELRRIQQAARSPIFAQFGETLEGLETVRAYGMTGLFLKRVAHLINEESKLYFQFQISQRWFSFYMELLVMTQMIIVVLLTVYLRDTTDPAMLSLTVVYAYSFSGQLQFAVRSSVDVENDFTAVERILYYEKSVDDPEYAKSFLEDKERRGIPREAAEVNKEFPMPKDKKWPSEGAIKLENLKLRYRKDLTLVLKGLNSEIKAGEKVGICGRTGAGKSSLMVALFRLVEPEKSSKIIIDGIDISKLGLRDLRSRLSIIPQDPVLFSGSVRFNLDPFHEYRDEQIWDILRRCELYEHIYGKTERLEYKVSEGGKNFSQGQRQLICIGRALLKNTKILLLDEATSSIDKHTDALIQKLIRENFKKRTVLTIAHRIETIMDYDRIMVLKEGVIAEFDTPQNLLKDENGLFWAMVNSGYDDQNDDDNLVGNEQIIFEEEYE